MPKLSEKPFKHIYCLDPELLADAHLLDEYRNLKGLIKTVIRGQNDPRGYVPISKRVKFSDFQHNELRFFVDKIEYVINRAKEVFAELLDRNLIDKSKAIKSKKFYKKKIKVDYMNGFYPTDRDLELSKICLLSNLKADLRHKYIKKIKYNGELITSEQYQTLVRTGDF